MPRRGMSANLLVRWLNDPMWLSLSFEATWLAHRALMWCIDQDRDGDVPNMIVTALAAGRFRPSALSAVSDELVAAGFWEAGGDGLLILNWADSQTTAEERGRRRRGNADRQQKLRDQRKADREWRRAIAGAGEGKDRDF